MSLLQIWQKAQSSIRDSVGPHTFDSWFSTIQIKEKNSETLLIEAPDEFFKNLMFDKYGSLIESTIKNISSQNIQIEYGVHKNFVDSRSDEHPQHPAPMTCAPAKIENKQSLNTRFSFENFVVGPSNRFCYAAARAVADSPAKAYNPLFIYGQVGLGKTHLMQAITHQILQNSPDTTCCYLSSEKFTNELIDAIRHRSTSQFRQKYRNIDVLLIDDIHFIAGKESTQEEFFHTFNTLHNNRKQIIISSDRQPREIANLEERLSSRFAWGLITDIQPPDFETRVAILKKKIEREPVDVPDNVITFIAEQIRTNIRELEGALIRVVAYSLLEENSISLEMAKAVLKDMVEETVKTINIETIQRTVCEFYNMAVSDLKSRRRTKNIIKPRQIAMYIARKLTNSSLPEIGNAFGGKDHTTVLHAFKKIEQDLPASPQLRHEVEKLITTLKN